MYQSFQSLHLTGPNNFQRKKSEQLFHSVSSKFWRNDYDRNSDWHVHSAVFKIDKQQGHTGEHREPCSILCGSLDGRGVWGRMKWSEVRWSRSVMSDSLWLHGLCQALASTGFSRQEYCSGLTFPSPGDLSRPRIEPASSALAGSSFTTEPPGKPTLIYLSLIGTPVIMLGLFQ